MVPRSGGVKEVIQLPGHLVMPSFWGGKHKWLRVRDGQILTYSFFTPKILFECHSFGASTDFSG